MGNAAAAQGRAARFLAGRSGARGALDAAPQAVGESQLAGQLAGSQLQLRGQAAGLAPTRAAVPVGGSADLTAPWQPLGPMAVTSLAYGPVTGRITALALDPNDLTGNTLWLGTTGGGVWKSTNAAGALASASFAPLTDTLPVFSANAGAGVVPSLSIGAVAVQPAVTAVVLAGTGDPNEATDSYYGEGILRSADGGQTWTLATGSKDGANGNHSFLGLATAGFAWNTATPTLAVAAMTSSTEGTAVGATLSQSLPGLYYSTDAGITWRMATVMDGNQVVQTPLPSGYAATGNNATAVVWDGPRGLFIAALSGHGYYGSGDGKTWTRLASQPGSGLTTANCPALGSANCPILRGALAVQPVTGDLFALTVDATDGDGGLWQDICNRNTAGGCGVAGPLFSVRLDAGALEAGQGVSGGSKIIPQGSYDLALAAAPTSGGGTVLFAGTVDLYRCTLASGATSCSWRNTTNAGNGCNANAGVAPAQHALAALAQSSGQNSGQPLLFLGNDGGLWRSIDGVAETGAACAATDASHFDNLNDAIAKGGSLAEIVGFAQDPTDPAILLAGLGAEGSAATGTAGALGDWPQMSAGEGGFPQLDPAQPNNWFLSVGAGANLKSCSRGTSCTAADFVPPADVGEAQVSYDAALLDAPTLLDPGGTSALMTATCRVWRGPAQNGASWSGANALSPAMDGSATPCSSTSALIRSVGAGGPVMAGSSPANTGSSVLYAGMAGAADGAGSLGGHLFITRTANTASAKTAWTDLTYNPVVNSSAGFNASGFDLSAVVVDAHDPTGATVYATVMGFGAGGDISHIYRSADFGAHWTDIGANLPNVPANSLVIDPNDANTVYLATDVGVYVTRAVTTCPAASCWGLLGAGLPNAPVTQIEAAAGVPTGDGRLGMLRAATYGRGLWQTPLLSAISTLQPKLTASPASLTFSTQPSATLSAAQTITLSSTGAAPVTVSSLVITGDFVESDSCTGQTLAVGSTCSVSVEFAPTAGGTRTGVLTAYANVAGGQVTVSLTGTGSAPAAVVLTPLTLSFPATIVNQTTPSQIITVSNTGGTAATLGTPSVTGDFAIVQNTCTGTLPSQTGCSLAIAFTPKAGGTRTGSLSVPGSAGTQTAQLSGTGQTPATDTLSPTALTFAQQQVGTISAPQQVVLTNAGDVPLSLVSAVVASGDFAAANGCGNTLPAHSTCAINITFVPTATGVRTGVLNVTDQVRTQVVNLSGTGVAPPGVSLTPAIASFPATGVGLTAPAQTLVLTNNGGLPLQVTSTAINGDFAIASSTCGSSLPVGGACNLYLFFAPTAAGARTGSLVLTDNAPSGTQTVSLSGTGVDFSLLTNGAASVSVASGVSATFPLVLNSLAGLNGSVAFTCAGAPAHSTCTVSPATAALGGKVLVSVVVQTGLQVAQLQPFDELQGSQPGTGNGRWLLALLPVAWIGFKRRKRVPQGEGLRLLGALFLLGAISLTLAALAGCGANRVIPLSGTGTASTAQTPTPTPTGTYPITVTGATAGVTHAVALSLTVQ